MNGLRWTTILMSLASVVLSLATLWRLRKSRKAMDQVREKMIATTRHLEESLKKSGDRIRYEKESYMKTITKAEMMQAIEDFSNRPESEKDGRWLEFRVEPDGTCKIKLHPALLRGGASDDCADHGCSDPNCC